jgi:hypothetical protein
MPGDETVAHKTPAGFDDQLSEIGRTNLERWYAWDVSFVQQCRELAPRLNASGLDRDAGGVVDAVQQQR